MTLAAKGENVARPAPQEHRVFGGAGAVAFFLVAKYGQPEHLETMEREGRGYLDLSADLLSGPLAFGPAITASHRLAFGLLALVGIALLFYPRFRRRGALTYLYVVLLGLLGLLMTLAGAAWQRERYLFLALPLLFLVGGQVLARLAGLLPLPALARRWLPAALALLVAAYVGLAGTSKAYVQEWGYDQAFRHLEDNWQPEAGDRLATSMSTAALLYLGHNDAFAIQHGYEEYVVERPGDHMPIDLWTATPVLTTTVLAALSWVPARVAGIDDVHGRPVAEGEPANLCVIDPEVTWVVDGAQMASRSTNTPYQGREVRGRVRHTVLHGEAVVVAGEPQR